jgi:hypothetical protein
MRLCVIDGRGGGLGRRLVQGLLPHVREADEIIVFGTNEAATEAMKLAGASRSGTGERQIIQAVPTVDFILASLNLVLAGAMLGEVTPGIASAILNAPGRKLLLPVNRMRIEVVGAEAFTLESVIEHTLRRVQMLLKSPASV